MSHFIVLVIGENPEKQLQLYHEYESTGIEDEYVIDIDITEEARKKYEEHKSTKYKAPDGSLQSIYDERFYREPTAEEKEKHNLLLSGSGGGISWSSRNWDDGKGYRTKIHFLPDGYEEIVIHTKSLKVFSEFVKDYYGKSLLKEGEEKTKDHKYGYVLVDENKNVVKVINRTNPNSKWDWYSLGGRWTGFFKVKEGINNYSIGRPGLMTDEAENGKADQIRKRDIDFDFMKKEAAEKAAKQYDEIMKIIGHLPVNKPWKEIADSYPENETQEAREAYWKQERCLAFKNENKFDSLDTINSSGESNLLRMLKGKRL